jgi:hypothetical protein
MMPKRPAPLCGCHGRGFKWGLLHTIMDASPIDWGRGSAGNFRSFPGASSSHVQGCKALNARPAAIFSFQSFGLYPNPQATARDLAFRRTGVGQNCAIIQVLSMPRSGFQHELQSPHGMRVPIGFGNPGRAKKDSRSLPTRDHSSSQGCPPLGFAPCKRFV